MKKRVSDCQTALGIEVQWRDMDALGHVNNAEYIRWFESVRIKVLQAMGLCDEEGKVSSSGLGPILASVSCDYLAPVVYPNRVLVGAFVSRVGRSSFNLEYVVERENDGKTVARGDSVVVQINYETGKSMALTPSQQIALSKL